MNRAFLSMAQPFVRAGLLTAADVHAVDLAAPRFGESDALRMLGLAFAVRAPRTGHAGVELSSLAQSIDVERLRPEARMAPTFEIASDARSDDERGDGIDELDSIADDEPSPPASNRDDSRLGQAAGTDPGLPWPEPAQWAEETFRSPMVGAPSAVHLPFVRQDIGAQSLLMTRRMFMEQAWLAEALLARAAAPMPATEHAEALESTLAALFGGAASGEAANAVRLASAQRLAVVIGGPGTGKTFSITRLLAALMQLRREGAPLSVMLAAPTGKAAARMHEAIIEATRPEARPPLRVSDAIRSSLGSLRSSTIHRLIGLRPDGSARHGKHAPLAADVVVVDEVSMVDLALMRRLVEAVPAHARLVLLGDRDQLASVEAGCVLSDMVGETNASPLERHICVLSRSHRFEGAPDVALIAACLQSLSSPLPGVPTDPAARTRHAIEVFAGRAHAAHERFPKQRIERLGSPFTPETTRTALPTRRQIAALAEPYLHGITRYLPDGRTEARPGYAQLLAAHLVSDGTFAPAAQDPAFLRRVLDALDAYRVLAVHRRGPLGVLQLERAIGMRVRQLLDPHGHQRFARHWVGRPILVTENAYDVGLLNGDVGLIAPTVRGVAAVFPGAGADDVKIVALGRLPAHEGALAMTVHKSQGSQFDRVALVLAGRESPIQTRELIYTGVTRARNQLAWLGGEQELASALDRRVTRASGLGALLAAARR